MRAASGPAQNAASHALQNRVVAVAHDDGRAVGVAAGADRKDVMTIEARTALVRKELSERAYERGDGPIPSRSSHVTSPLRV